jgi:WD40 repeat protein
MAVDAKGESLFTLGAEGELMAWGLASGKQIWSHTDPALHRLESTDKKLVVVGTIPLLWTFDSEDGKQMSAIGGPPPYTETAGFASDSRGRWAWIGQERGLIRVTPGDVNGWSRRGLDIGGVTTLALSSDDDLLAVGGKDGTVRFANCKSANVDDKRVLRGHTGAVSALAFAGKTLVSGGEDGTVRVWNLASSKQKHFLREKGPVVSILAGEQSVVVAAAGASGELVVWDAGKGAELARWKNEAGAAIVALDLADKGRTLAVAAGARVLVFDLEVP